MHIRAICTPIDCGWQRFAGPLAGSIPEREASGVPEVCVPCELQRWSASAVGHHDHPCPCACSISSSSGSAAGWSCSAGHRHQRTPKCSCCGTKSRCCAGHIPGPGWTGLTARSSLRRSGSCPEGCKRTGWSPQVPSCAGTAASSPASGPTRTGRDGRRSAPSHRHRCRPCRLPGVHGRRPGRARRAAARRRDLASPQRRPPGRHPSRQRREESWPPRSFTEADSSSPRYSRNRVRYGGPLLPVALSVPGRTRSVCAQAV
jgi:hypothetical protein